MEDYTLPTEGIANIRSENFLQPPEQALASLKMIGETMQSITNGVSDSGLGNPAVSPSDKLQQANILPGVDFFDSKESGGSSLLEYSDLCKKVADNAPQEVAQTNPSTIDSLREFAHKENLTVQDLDENGIENANQWMKNVVENCPQTGQSETVTGGLETGLTTVDERGRRVPRLTGETHDRYFKSSDGVYTHVRSVNTSGVPAEWEQVVETSDKSKMYMYKQVPGNEVRVTVVSPDGKSGFQINMTWKQANGLLDQVKENQPSKQGSS